MSNAQFDRCPRQWTYVIVTDGNHVFFPRGFYGRGRYGKIGGGDYFRIRERQDIVEAEPVQALVGQWDIRSCKAYW